MLPYLYHCAQMQLHILTPKFIMHAIKNNSTWALNDARIIYAAIYGIMGRFKECKYE